MKKKLLLITILFISLFTLVGCESKKKEETKKEETSNSPIIKFTGMGLSATVDTTNSNFKYNRNYKAIANRFENKDLDVVVSLSFDSYETSAYESIEKDRKNSDLEIDGYEGFTFDEFPAQSYFMVKVRESDNEIFVLAGNINYIENENTNTIDAFYSDEVQEFIKSIKIEGA